VQHCAASLVVFWNEEFSRWEAGRFRNLFIKKKSNHLYTGTIDKMLNQILGSCGEAKAICPA